MFVTLWSELTRALGCTDCAGFENLKVFEGCVDKCKSAFKSSGDEKECEEQCKKLVLEENCCTTDICPLPKKKLRLRGAVESGRTPEEDMKSGDWLREYLGLDEDLITRSDPGSDSGLDARSVAIEKRGFHECCSAAHTVKRFADWCPKTLAYVSLMVAR